MKTLSFGTKLGLAVFIATLISGCAGSVRDHTGMESPHHKTENGRDKTTESIEKSPGIIVHIDPKTGKVKSPAPGELPDHILKPPPDAVKKPPQPLRETLSPVPGGGVVIELDDRFQTPLSATIDAGGKVRFEHKPTMCSPDDNK